MSATDEQTAAPERPATTEDFLRLAREDCPTVFGLLDRMDAVHDAIEAGATEVEVPEWSPEISAAARAEMADMRDRRMVSAARGAEILGITNSPNFYQAVGGRVEPEQATPAGRLWRERDLEIFADLRDRRRAAEAARLAERRAEQERRKAEREAARERRLAAEAERFAERERRRAEREAARSKV